MFKRGMFERGLDFKWQRINSVRHHSKRDHETLKHYILKCLVGRILNSADHVYFTEFEFPNKAQSDVYDATDNIVIEIESRKSEINALKKFEQYRPYARDIFVFYCEDFPDDPVAAERLLKDKLGI